MGGYRDPVLWQAVQAEQRYLVTADKGFADTRRYKPGAHAGVLLLRPAQDGISPTIELLEMVLQDYELESACRDDSRGHPSRHSYSARPK